VLLTAQTLTPVLSAKPGDMAAQGTTNIYLPIATSPRVPKPLSYWGVNLYLTKVERRGTGDNLPLLADLAAQAGVR
jgi:hypothetical protein